jgi:transposase
VPKKKYLVLLGPAERAELERLIREGVAPARAVTHARILLDADVGEQGTSRPDEAIASALNVSRPTIERVRKRFSTDGLSASLYRRAPDREYRTKLDRDQEQILRELAASPPPSGQARWTLRLLADRMVQLGHVDSISYETIRRTLKRAPQSA